MYTEVPDLTEIDFTALDHFQIDLHVRPSTMKEIRLAQMHLFFRVVNSTSGIAY